MFDPALHAHLRARTGAFVALVELERLLGASAAEVFREVQAMRRGGYDVEFDPGRGVRLAVVPDLVDPRELGVALVGPGLGGEVLHAHEVGSTQDVAWERAEAGCAGGLVVVAERQLAGRGRFRRAWHSPPGRGVWMSVVLGPEPPREWHAAVCQAAAAAVGEALVELGVDPAVKWPNDLVLGDRKVAGVLVESRVRDDEIRMVVGIGINANQTAGEFPPDLRDRATSIREALGHPVDRARLACRCLEGLALHAEALRAGDTERLDGFYAARCETVGQRVRLSQGNEVFTGKVLEVSPTAGLTLELDGGSVRVFRGEHATLAPS